MVVLFANLLTAQMEEMSISRQRKCYGENFGHLLPHPCRGGAEWRKIGRRAFEVGVSVYRIG